MLVYIFMGSRESLYASRSQRSAQTCQTVRTLGSICVPVKPPTSDRYRTSFAGRNGYHVALVEERLDRRSGRALRSAVIRN